MVVMSVSCMYIIQEIVVRTVSCIMYNTIYMIWIILHSYLSTHSIPTKVNTVFYLRKLRKCTKFNDFLLDILFLLSAM